MPVLHLLLFNTTSNSFVAEHLCFADKKKLGMKKMDICGSQLIFAQCLCERYATNVKGLAGGLSLASI